ncbi:hypothetical protein [Sphingomonas sp. CLY1604]|uniref:hypothetical protein n=1 Tax=Sphingomonas sp. CLY1604 TaxID=3457786 RepID=UPI003FD864BC
MKDEIDPTIDEAPISDPGDRARRDMRNVDQLCGQLRRAVFRRYVRSQLIEMSSPVAHLLDGFGLDLPTALRRLYPTASWPRLAGDVEPHAASFANLRRGGTHVGWPRSSPADARKAPMGSLVLKKEPSSEIAEVKLVGRCLELLVMGETFEFHTQAGRGRFVHRSNLPATMWSSVTGRPLDQVVRHPLLYGRGYVVDRSGDHLQGTFFEFDVGTERATMSS